MASFCGKLTPTANITHVLYTVLIKCTLSINFTHSHAGQKHTHTDPIKSHINCNSTHVVYMLRCLCGVLYLGQTKRALKIGISEQKTAILTQSMDYAIAWRFAQVSCGPAASLKFWGIEKMQMV